MSDNIFRELCNRVLSLFKQTESVEENAKDVACNRLRVVLMQDRTNLTPELLQRMRRELVELLSKYVEMDKEALELNFDQEGDQMALMLSIPVIRAKDEAEIEEALKLEDEKKNQETDSDEEEENSDETEAEEREVVDSETSDDDDTDVSEKPTTDAEVLAEDTDNEDEPETVEENDSEETSENKE